MSPHSAASDRHIPASSDILNEKVLTVLKDVVMRRTSARSLSERLGHSHNYVRRILSGEITLQLETLFDMLQELGLPPRLFFARVFAQLPDTDPAAVLRFYREGDGLPPDPFLEEIEPRIASLAQRPTIEAEVESRRDRLDRLEEERFEDREAAKERLEALAEEILDDVEANAGGVPLTYAEELAICLGIWAVIRRVSGFRDDSSRMYELAFALTAPGPSSEARALLLRKSSYLLRDLDAAFAGLHFLRQAQEHYVQQADFESTGETLLDRGILHGHLGHDQRAEELFEAALRLLPEDARKYRASAYSSLAHHHQMDGRLESAHTLIREARVLYEGGTTDLVLAQILLTEARLSAKLGLLSEAEDAFQRSMKAYGDASHPGYVAVAALDYASLLLSQGRTEDLAALADEMFECLRLLRSNRIIDALLMEFIRTAKWGELTQEFIKDARRQLQEAASRPS